MTATTCLPGNEQITKFELPSCHSQLAEAYSQRVLAFCLQISVGDAGYMVNPPATPGDEPLYPDPLDDGAYGVDFVRNMQDPNIAFGTVQLCAGPNLTHVSALQRPSSILSEKFRGPCVSRL